MQAQNVPFDIEMPFSVDSYFEDVDEQLKGKEAKKLIPRYDPKVEEELPIMTVAALHPAFREAERIISQDVIRPFRTKINELRSKNPSKELDLMAERAEEYETPPELPPLIVGVRGRSDTGKTTAAHTLMDVHNLGVLTVSFVTAFPEVLRPDITLRVLEPWALSSR
jgi:hypothetical protein